MKHIIVTTTLLAVLFSGCSSKVFLPYEEEPLCKIGAGQGYCGSVSDIYKLTIKKD